MANKFDIDRFDDCPTKEWLHSNMYTYASRRMKSDALIVSGPAVERHIKEGLKIARTPKAMVYLIENNMKIYAEMRERYEKLLVKQPELCNKVRIVSGDVAGYELAIGRSHALRFEDLDMCASIRSLRYLLSHRLYIQSRLAGNPAKLRKCFMFTTSLHNCPFDETVEILQKMVLEILEAKVVLWNMYGVEDVPYRRYRSNGVKEYFPYFQKFGRLLNNGLHFFTYGDKSPMFSCMIFYV